MNKDPNIVPKEALLIILDSKFALCMSNNGKDTKHIMHIARGVHFVINGEKCVLHKIYWYEVGLQLADIEANTADENDLNPRIKYIMVILDK